jgi:AraC-like DNA-binding protein
MAKNEPGVIRCKGIYFHNASEFAQKNLPYLLFGGIYTCDIPYSVNREYLDSFILFFIEEGAMEFDYRGRQFTAGPCSTVFLDCKYRNTYYAKRPVRFQWFHFRGGNTQAYCDLLFEDKGCLFGKTSAMKVSRQFDQIMTLLKDGVIDDHDTGACIQSIFTALAETGDKTEYEKSAAIRKSIFYMQEHYARELLVSEIADAAGMSIFHFSRIFRQYTGNTPHDYLFGIRMTHAKRLLTGTDKPVESIALHSGFSSLSHFGRAFKKFTGLTPSEFRELQL